MNKKGKASSSMERKKVNKISATNNKKEVQSKPKQTFNKSMEKKRKFIPSEIRINTNIETKTDKDKKIHLTKQRNEKSANSRSAKTNKGKEYENTLNKLTEDNEFEKEREKEYDFFNFKISNDDYKKKKQKIIKLNQQKIMKIIPLLKVIIQKQIN